MSGRSLTWQFASITSWALRILNIDISQGSVVTSLKCGGIFKYELVANLPVSLPVKEFWKSVNICGSYGQEFGVLFFETQCSVNIEIFVRQTILVRQAPGLLDLFLHQCGVDQSGSGWRRKCGAQVPQRGTVFLSHSETRQSAMRASDGI